MQKKDVIDIANLEFRCLFCNTLLDFNEKGRCKRCKAFALFNEDDFSFLNDDRLIRILSKENKLRRKMIDENNEMLMYYPFTDEQLSKVLTKKQLESLHKVLNNESLETADRNRLFLMRKKIDNIKKMLVDLAFIKEFEYP